ncbi:hypothetical protein [Aeromicrobium sp. Sec7.5]|uniref:hypothetical protein n=1 Tax=Aeromicrobium sp. Sec7.5 TaxID=3121276 RepID=UPI002FE44DDC
MGFRDWLTGRKPDTERPREFVVNLTAGVVVDPLVKVTGTTTHGKGAAGRLVARKQLADHIPLHIDGQLQREPSNPVDKLAVAVHVEGERIGYLPSHIAKSLRLDAGAALPCALQIFCANTGTGTRVEAWAWVSDGDPQWRFSEASPPPLTTGEKRSSERAAIDHMVNEALAGDGERAKQFKAARVNGVHYLQLIEPIKQLKREGRLLDALELCEIAIRGAEKDRQGREPAPWYTEQAAIIHRKLGNREAELAVLRRWISACPPQRVHGSKIAERLAKLEG